MTRTELVNAVKNHNTCCHALNKCNARYYLTMIEGRVWYVLESYQTLVAAVDVENYVCYVFDWWSSTTTEHTSKFAKNFGAKKVYLYKHSRMLKADWEESYNCDFANKIL